MAEPKTIRVLHRSLQLLEAANLNNGGQLRDFVQHSGLPKSTAHRILENLVSAGYLRRDPGDDHYYLTLKVRRLSDGYFEGGWISEAARPVIEKLAEQVRFPLAITTPFGAEMMIRDNTDAVSTLAPNVFPRGTTVPLLTSASGKVFLAFCDDITRKTLVDVCRASDRTENRLARHPDQLDRMLRQVRKQGHAFGRGATTTRVAVPTETIAVPIRARGQLVGCLAMRYLSAGMSRTTVAKRFSRTLQSHALQIGKRVAAETGRLA